MNKLKKGDIVQVRFPNSRKWSEDMYFDQYYRDGPNFDAKSLNANGDVNENDYFYCGMDDGAGEVRKVDTHKAYRRKKREKIQLALIKVNNAIKDNKVMTKIEHDGIYIRMAGNEKKEQAFSLIWAKVYDFKNNERGLRKNL